MREVAGDIWEAHGLGHWIAITTNGIVNRQGKLVMGRGVALQAAKRFDWLPTHLGDRVRDAGNHVHAFPSIRLFSYPVKHHWKEGADLALIERSAKELVDFVTDLTARKVGPMIHLVCLVRPGCGSGGLEWSQIRPLLAPILDDRFIIVQK